MPAIFTQSGQDWLVDKMSNVVSSTMDWLAWGTDGTAEQESDTALGAEAAAAGSNRTQGTITQPQSDTYRVSGTLTAESNVTISEVGLFDALTGGVLGVRGTHAGIPLEEGDQITYTLDTVVDSA